MSDNKNELRRVTEGDLDGYGAAKARIAALLPSPAGAFQFVAAFDGTWNDRDNLALSGNRQPTNDE